MGLPALAACGVIAAALSAGVVQTADARQPSNPDSRPTIVACSKYGSKCISAKVRATDLGLQYRSPGGSWIWCEHDCVDTLRRDTVDFWDDQRERSK